MRFRLLLVSSVLLLLGCASVHAQTPVTNKQNLVWDMPSAPDVATAQTYTYKYYIDNSTTGVALSGVTCTAGTPISCKTQFPSTTAGGHSITVSAGNTAGDSLPSTPLQFSFVVIPGIPQNLRIGDFTQ